MKTDVNGVQSTNLSDGSRSQIAASKSLSQGKREKVGSVQLKISFMRKRLFDSGDVNLEYRSEDSNESSNI